MSEAKQPQITVVAGGRYIHGKPRPSATNDPGNFEPPGWVREDLWEPTVGKADIIYQWALSPNDNSFPYLGPPKGDCVGCQLRHPHTSSYHLNCVSRAGAVLIYCPSCPHVRNYHACYKAQAEKKCPGGVERHYK